MENKKENILEVLENNPESKIYFIIFLLII